MISETRNNGFMVLLVALGLLLGAGMVVGLPVALTTMQQTRESACQQIDRGPMFVVVQLVEQAREAFRREQCKENLKQIALAMENHQEQWPPSQVARMTLADALAVIKSKQFVDLTHAFEPGIPHWPGFPDEKRETLYWYEGDKGKLGKGFFAQQFTHVGQWGTHCDPPAHFVKGKRAIDQIDPKEMILPLVVIDVHEKAAKNPDYAITMDDVRDWERRYGPVPEGAFVAMRTDWSKRWPDAKAM